MKEIVEDGRTGFHFTPGDARDLAEKVDWAWNNPDRMRVMGEEARQEYESKYTEEKNYPRLMEIYQHAIHGAKPKLHALSAEGGAEHSSSGDCQLCATPTTVPDSE